MKLFFTRLLIKELLRDAILQIIYLTNIVVNVKHALHFL
jgi:hypothetical protein